MRPPLGAITLFEAAGGTLRLRPGDRVVGRWSGRTIAIERWLGEGANGSVYLARDPLGPSHCALKIGNDAYTLQSEINALQKVGPSAPKLLLSDDGACRGAEFPFYVMAFVPGVPLGEAAGTASPAELYAWGERLLGRLGELHAAGWAFGDVKPANVLIDRGGEARLVDFGGATTFGQSVKQFSELYDRGFWKLGNRRADPAYDLFAFAVAMLEAAGMGKRLRAIAGSSRRGKARELLELPGECAPLSGAAGVLRRMLRGGYEDAERALADWRAAAERGPAAGERWPAIWFAGALAAFVGVVWRMSGG